MITEKKRERKKRLPKDIEESNDILEDYRRDVSSLDDRQRASILFEHLSIRLFSFRSLQLTNRTVARRTDGLEEIQIVRCSDLPTRIDR